MKSCDGFRPAWLEDILTEMTDDDLVEWPSPPPIPGHLRRVAPEISVHQHRALRRGAQRVV